MKALLGVEQLRLKHGRVLLLVVDLLLGLRELVGDFRQPGFRTSVVLYCILLQLKTAQSSWDHAPVWMEGKSFRRQWSIYRKHSQAGTMLSFR